MFRQKNYDDLIINSEKYTYSDEHDQTHNVDAHRTEAINNL